jgi:signal transduction histidine kinase/ActR/RegA family two-component response regulator
MGADVEIGSASLANVLVVDDQPGKLLTYRTILEGVPANLLTAGSGREALDLLLKTEIAVVLMDVCMPEIDGFELASLIRDHPRFRQTAIIFVSGVHLTDLDRLKGYECGAVDYLPVPIVPEILRAKVNVFVDLYRKTRALERLNLELEQRVAQRTAALEEAGRYKDEFLAVLAHELRNPLAAIRAAAHVIGFPTVTPVASAQSAKVIERQVEHLVRLVDDLVDVSRITRGIVELRRAPVEIAAVVARAVETSQPLVEMRGLDLSVEVGPRPLQVDGDLTRLTQALTNVLCNAAKFTEPGGRVTVTAEPVGPDVVIRVVDTGVGIAKDILPTVFELFAQGERKLDRTSTGLGIGLAVVRRLVELHGGTATIDSGGAGLGTAVTIRLPLLVDPAVEAPGAAAARPSETVEPIASSVEPCRVLVVDDNADAAEGVAAMLRMCGHEVMTAEDGVAALHLAESFAPDVALLDLGMPRLDGYETARRIREQPSGRRMALVALTGWGQPRDRDSTRQAGFDAHLVKPIASEELLETLRRIRRGPPGGHAQRREA